ncbi:MAG: tetratricopeptide repeat protein [Armatimonadota bacterium]|nr:tetratricopeptide repeat protein [bacterium]
MTETDNTTEQGRAKGSAARLSGLMKRANSLVEQGMFDEAIENIKEAIALCPRDPKISIQLANIYRAQNRMGPAIEAMQNAVELDPKDGDIQQQLLRTLLEMGRYDEAITTSCKLLKKYPRNLLARDILGIAYLQQGRLDSALKVTNELIRLAPTDAAHHFKKGVLLQQKGEIGQAMSAFLFALQMEPEGELADDAREAIAALDSFQLRQVLTLAVEDAVFRTKLALNTESALIERGFHLSSAGVSTLKQLDLGSLPGDSQSRYYH